VRLGTTMATDELLNEIRDLIAEREELGIRGLADRLGPSDWADIVVRLDEDEVTVLLESIPDDEIPEILEELDPANAAAILRLRSREEAADLLEAIDPDDATDIIAELPSQDREQILEAMEPDEAAEIRQLSTYPPDTAGGRMTPAFVAISPDVRADDALVLHNLVLTRPQTPVSEVMVADPIRVRADADQETAANLLVDKNLLALPVVDEQDHLLGIITQDDVADVLEEETTEDFERIGGSQPLDVPYRFATAGLLVRRRIGWLLILFVAGLLTSQVLEHYSDRLQGVPALIPYIPLIIGIGGNVGSQTVTTLVRAIGVGEVRLVDVGWVLAKEMAVGLSVGLIMGFVGYLRVGFPEGFQIGLVVGATIACVALWSATVAAVLPLVLEQIGIDPAVVSAPLISTFVDATGLLIYMTIAGLLLLQL